MSGLRLTDLERTVALRIHRGEDPWGTGHGQAAGGSRKVSQTIGRLMRKGAVILSMAHGPCGRHVLTDEGRKALTSESNREEDSL